MLGGQGSANVLEQLAHSNLLLVALDRRRQWYRYHHLFRDMLRASSAVVSRRWCPRSTARAAGWFEANRLPELAIDHTQAGVDVDAGPTAPGAALAPAHVRGDAVDTVLRWLAWFDDHDLVEQYPAGRGARCTVPHQHRRCGHGRTLGHCRGASGAGAARRRQARANNERRPSEYFPTAARWRVGLPFFAAFSVETASSAMRRDVESALDGLGAGKRDGDALHSWYTDTPVLLGGDGRPEPTRSLPRP